MARPFDLTLQAHRLDLHGLWVAVLGVVCVLALAWGWWAVTDHGGVVLPASPTAAPPTTPATAAGQAPRPARPLSPIRTRHRE